MPKFTKPSESLAWKLILSIGALMVAASAFIGILLYKYERNVTLRHLNAHAEFVSGLVLLGFENEMLAGSGADINKTIDMLNRSGNFREAVIFGPGGHVAYPLGMAAGRDREADPNVMAALGGQRIPPVLGVSPAGISTITHYSAIPNRPACFNAACHVHPASTKVIGVQKISFGAETLGIASREVLLGTLVLGVLFVVTVSAFLFYINYRLITRPLGLLSQGIDRLAAGDFERPIEIRTRDEIGLLAARFNTMAQNVHIYKDRLENWAHELEVEVQKKADEIKAAQDQLLNAEKLASLGRLAAGVAHELNNPLTGVVTFAHLMKKRTPADNKEDHEDLDMIIEQSDRCTKIIKGLLGFSRKETSDTTDVDINDLVQSCIAMIRNQSAFHNIEIKLALGQGMGRVLVDPNQIVQVFLNLLTNAADAMNNAGALTITSSAVSTDDGRFVDVSFTDTGPGILPEHLGKILEPFFTTKSIGKGTGLGLPVSYGIIKKHGGDLTVRSQVGRGSTFTVRLPAR